MLGRGGIISMKAILLNGSPRKDGSSAHLLEVMAKKLSERECHTITRSALDLLSELETPFCTHCSRVCEGQCYRGTAVEEFYDLVPQVDCLVVASPVYFGTVSAEVKALWDLGRKIRSEKGLLYTVGAGIATGGGRFGGQETTIRAIHDMMFIQGMIVVGDSSPGGIGHQGVAASDPATGDQNAEKRLEIMAEAVADVSWATRELRSFRTREG